MPKRIDELLSELTVEAGSIDDLERLVRARKVAARTKLADQALAGVYDLTVSDWDRLSEFLIDGRPGEIEVKNYEMLCDSVRAAVKNQDPTELLKNLMLVFRVATTR